MAKHDDIPPIEVLEAAAKKERDETQELLAGFDRPGRGPKRARRGDFVAHYSRERAAPLPPEAEGREKATFVLPKRARAPEWLPWVGLATAMLLFGGTVAFFATAECPRPAASPPAPSATTTITSAQPRRGEIPAPGPAAHPRDSARSSEGVDGSAESAHTSKPRSSRAARTHESADPDRKLPLQRDDYIRDL